MATHSSILPWRIPGTEEPDGPQSTGTRLKHLSMHPCTRHRMLGQRSRCPPVGSRPPRCEAGMLQRRYQGSECPQGTQPACGRIKDSSPVLPTPIALIL